ncbi:MAG: hypothetical protein ACYC42_11115 [Lysobacter sp.]
MIRKLVLPALAAALLSGCVTDYAYRGGDRGDYYYGQPRTEYRYDGGYGGYAPYGYGSYGYGPYGYPYRHYGTPYGYGGYYNRPYYPPYYRPYYPRPPVTHPHPDGNPPPQQRRDDRPPPWRNYDQLRRRQSADGGPANVQPREVVPARPAAVEPRERGSRMQQTIRRANRSAEPLPIEQEP